VGHYPAPHWNYLFIDDVDLGITSYFWFRVFMETTTI